MIFEVDENNIIKAAYPVGHGLQPSVPLINRPIRPPSRGHDTRIKWRFHEEIALEADTFKQPIVLHDLVDPENVEIMVMKGDCLVIQGSFLRDRSFYQMSDIVEKAAESMAFAFDKQVLISHSSLKTEHLAKRRLRRQGGLVDIHYKPKIMSEERAKELMEKTWSIPGLTIIVVSVSGPSLPGLLKPGRRLIPSQEVFGDGAALTAANNGHAD